MAEEPPPRPGWQPPSDDPPRWEPPAGEPPPPAWPPPPGGYSPPPEHPPLFGEPPAPPQGEPPARPQGTPPAPPPGGPPGPPQGTPPAPPSPGPTWPPPSPGPTWPPPTPGYGGPFGHPPQAPETSGKATAALILGICGLVVCPFVLSIVALVLGYQARREIDASGGRLGGRGNATAGIVMGWIGIGFGLLIIAFFVFGLAAGIEGGFQDSLHDEDGGGFQFSPALLGAAARAAGIALG